jgi:vacuolar-type H+-ATPase subunit D/Vma8
MRILLFMGLGTIILMFFLLLLELRNILKHNQILKKEVSEDLERVFARLEDSSSWEPTDHLKVK